MEENYLWELVDLQTALIGELRGQLSKANMGLELMTQKYMELEEQLQNGAGSGLRKQIYI